MITRRQAENAIANVKLAALKREGLASKPKRVLEEVEGFLKYHGVDVIDIEVRTIKPFPYSTGDFLHGVKKTEEPTNHFLSLNWSSYE